MFIRPAFKLIDNRLFIFFFFLLFFCFYFRSLFSLGGFGSFRSFFGFGSLFYFGSFFGFRSLLHLSFQLSESIEIAERGSGSLILDGRNCVGILLFLRSIFFSFVLCSALLIIEHTAV